MRTSENSKKGKLHLEGDQADVTDKKRKAWDKVFLALLGQAETGRLPGRVVVGMLMHLWVVGLVVVEVNCSLKGQSSVQKVGTHLSMFWS